VQSRVQKPLDEKEKNNEDSPFDDPSFPDLQHVGPSFELEPEPLKTISNAPQARDRSPRRMSWFRPKSYTDAQVSADEAIITSTSREPRSRSREPDIARDPNHGVLKHMPEQSEDRVSSSVSSSGPATSDEKQVQTPPTPPAEDPLVIPQRRKSWLMRRFSSESSTRASAGGNKLRKRSRTPTRRSSTLEPQTQAGAEEVPPVPRMPASMAMAMAPVELPGSTPVGSNPVSRTNSSRYSPDDFISPVSPVEYEHEPDDDTYVAYELPALAPWSDEIDDLGPVLPVTWRRRADGRAWCDDEVALDWAGAQRIREQGCRNM